MSNPGVWILLVAVVFALAFGTFRMLRDGRFDKPSTPVEDGAAPDEPTEWSSVNEAIPSAQLGERATLVQFSSAFCSPCRATRQVLGDIAATVPGVVHLEVDAEQHLELVRTLGVMRTPTTLILDSAGSERTRAAGLPRKEQVLSALAGASDA